MGLMKLYDYQQQAVEFSKARKYSYLAIPCGGGKTFASLEATKHNDLVLIICPASLCELWADEIGKIYGIERDLIFVPPTASAKIPDAVKYIIVSYDKCIRQSMYKALFKTNYTGVIVDEAHKIKNPRSKRTQALVGWQGKAKRLLTKDNIKQCILLSGTPMMQRPWELYSVLRGLIPDELGPYSKSSMYAIHFCKGYKDVYGRWITNGSDNLEELSEITKKLIFPVSRERIERNLPPIRKQIVRLSCGGTYLAQEKAYNIESLEDITSSIGFEGLSELRHLMAIQKIPYIQDYVKNLLLSGEKVIVFAWHRAVLQSILTYVQALSLPRDVLLLDGSVPPSQRQSLCHKFNTENYSIALCQISAVSEGLSLHTATHVVFSEISWNPSDNEQALKRVHRKGQESPVLAHYLVVKNSLDDRILKNVLTKEAVVSKFTTLLNKDS